MRLLLAGLLFSAIPARADYTSTTIGSTAAEFLLLTPNARAAALGEAYCAASDDASALYWNPAALSQISGRSLTMMHASYLQDSSFDYGAYGQDLGGYGGLGVGVQYFSAGAMPQTENYVSVGSFSPYDLAISAGYGFAVRNIDPDLDGFALGATLKYIQSRIVVSAQTAAMDFGILSPAYLKGRLRLALTADNLGGTLRYGQESESLPKIFRLGSTYALIPGSWSLNADAAFSRGGQPFLALGSERSIMVTSGVRAAGRIGYNSRTAGSINGVTGISLGAGLSFSKLDFDYAFAPFGGLGFVHRLSLNARF